MHIKTFAAVSAFAALALSSTSAFAIGGEGKKTRVGLGAQLVPSYPGSDEHSIRPLVDVSRADVGEVFGFEAADESFGFSFLGDSPFGVGLAANYEGSRKAKDVGAPLDKVDATFELGGFVQYELTPAFRARAEVRKGLGGHEGWVGMASLDYVMRDGDAWLFAIGPRVTASDGKYHRAYFGVTPDEALATGLDAFSPDGGIHAVGANATLLFQVSDRIGVYSYAKYDRLVGDAADSPIVREYGDRTQLSGGLGLTYTFGGGASSPAQ